MLVAGNTVQGRGVNDREIQLFFGCAQGVKQVKHLVNHPIRAGTGAVNLVHHNDRIQASLEGLGGDKAGLGHRAVHGINQQQDRIDH